MSETKERKTFSAKPREALKDMCNRLENPVDVDSLPDIARALLDMDAEWNFPESVLQKQVIALQKKGEIPRSKKARFVVDNGKDLSVPIAVPKHLAPIGTISKEKRREIMRKYDGSVGVEEPVAITQTVLVSASSEPMPSSSNSSESAASSSADKKRPRHSMSDYEDEDGDDDEDPFRSTSPTKKYSPAPISPPFRPSVDLDLHFISSATGMRQNVVWYVNNMSTQSGLIGCLFLRIEVGTLDSVRLVFTQGTDTIKVNTTWEFQNHTARTHFDDVHEWASIAEALRCSKPGADFSTMTIALPARLHGIMTPHRSESRQGDRLFVLFKIPLANKIDDSAWTRPRGFSVSEMSL